MNDRTPIRRAGIVFSGGPAPGANAVIAAAAMGFPRAGCEVIGFLDGYANLIDHDASRRPLTAGTDYFLFEDHHLRGLRNARGKVHKPTIFDSTLIEILLDAL